MKLKILKHTYIGKVIAQIWLEKLVSYEASKFYVQMYFLKFFPGVMQDLAQEPMKNVRLK